MKLLDYNSKQLQNKLADYFNKYPDYKKIFYYSKKRFLDDKKLTAHNWAHAYRDTINAVIIGESEKADMSIVLPAITMHDIGFLYGAEGKNHGEIGAIKVAEFVKLSGAKYSKEQIQKIAECIKTHKGDIHGESPESLEAKVVADADLLEKFGYFGVYQTIRTYTEFNWPIDKAIDRGYRILTVKLETETGKKLAEPGRQFVSDFYKGLEIANQPYEGEEN